jgi:hypothetical protein
MFAGIMAGCGTFTPTPATTLPSPASALPLLDTIDLPTDTPAPAPVFARARSQPVNCRFGPGTIYEIISLLEANQITQVEGRDYSDMWLHVHDPLNPGGFCWVSLPIIELDGDLDSLPVIDPPHVTVNKLEVRVEPQRVTVACENFPQFVLFVAEVTVNGPSLVNWRWEISTGETTEAQTLLFEQAETKILQKSFVIERPNDYWVRLHINAPNEKAEQANFVANCTP